MSDLMSLVGYTNILTAGNNVVALSGIDRFVVTRVSLETSANNLVGNLDGIARVEHIQGIFIADTHSVLDGETEALDVEPAVAHVDELDATEVLYALQIRLDGVSDLVLTGTNLIDVELHHDAITRILAVGVVIATVEGENLILGEIDVVVTVALVR